MYRTVILLVVGCALGCVTPSRSVSGLTPLPVIDAVPVSIVEPVQVVAPQAPVVPELPAVTYELRRGESLAHFARWAGLPVEVIAERSHIPLEQDLLPVGTLIRVPLDEDGRNRVEIARDAHHVRRAEGWLSSRGGSVGTEFYRVRTGDSAWTIARDHGHIPVWVIETYNPSVSLESLRPGQELMLPIVSDTSVATNEE